jgi:hypothetical protein
VRFEPFFLNLMLREMAPALGLSRTVATGEPVAAALGPQAEAVAAAKAMVLSLWLAERLHARGELPGTTPAEHYASFLAGSLRSLQLDPAGPAARARLLVLNHCRDWGALGRDAATGRYHVDAAQMPAALAALAAQLLTLEGSGDRAGAAELLDYGGVLRPELAADLARLAAAGLPDRIVFRQGEDLLGL